MAHRFAERHCLGLVGSLRRLVACLGIGIWMVLGTKIWCLSWSKSCAFSVHLVILNRFTCYNVPTIKLLAPERCHNPTRKSQADHLRPERPIDLCGSWFGVGLALKTEGHVCFLVELRILEDFRTSELGSSKIVLTNRLPKVRSLIFSRP